MLIRILVLWVGLVGAMVASREDDHIHIDLLERYLPEHIQNMLERKRRLVQEENAEHLAMDPEEPETWDEADWENQPQEPDDDCPF